RNLAWLKQGSQQTLAIRVNAVTAGKVHRIRTAPVRRNQLPEATAPVAEEATLASTTSASGRTGSSGDLADWMACTASMPTSRMRLAAFAVASAILRAASSAASRASRTSLPGVPACEGNVRGCSTSTTGAAVSDTCEATGRSGAQAASNIPNEAATMAAALLIQTFLKNKKATGQTYAFRTKLQARLVCMQQTVATRQHFLADQINRPAWRA